MTPDLSKTDLDHLTAKSGSMEHAIIGKQHLTKVLIEEIIKRHLTSNNSFI